MRENIIKTCDKAIEWLIYISIFWMPFFKAGLEIGITLMFIYWVIKRIAVFNPGENYKIWHPGLRWLLIFRPIKTPLNLVLGIFVLAAYISIFRSAYIMRSMNAFFFRLLEWVFVYFAIAETIICQKRLKNICVAIILSALVVAADAFIQHIRGVDLICGRKLVQDRITSCFGHFNTFAMWLGPVIVLMFNFILYTVKNRDKRIGIFFILLLLSVCLIFAGSRGGWVSLFATLVLLAITRDKRGFYLIGMIVIIFIMVGLVDKRASNPKILRLDDSGRSGIWKDGIRMFNERPVFGFGINTFMYNYPRYMTTTPRDDYKSDLPHNCYLMIAVEMGIFGITAFLFFIYGLFWNIFATLRQMPKDSFLGGVLTGLLGALTCYLIHSFFDNNLQTMQTAFLFWFMAGMVIACLNIWQKEKEILKISSL